MAKEVLREESNRPSRLWDPSEVYAVLNENNVAVSKAVEVLVLLLEKSPKKVHIDSKAFANMKKLRILKICHPEPKDHGQPFELKISMDFNVNFSGSLDFLSNELRLIYWHGYPFKFLPSNFYPENVVAIDLSYSNIRSFWTTPKCFRRLKVMKLRHCRNLTTTPDFTEMTNLEELILEGCVSLVKLHPSIGMLKKLVTLNMRDCIQIRSFPNNEVEMDSLQLLILSGCLKLDNLTWVSGTIKTLVKLYADQTAVTGFPSFISSLTNLQVLEIGRYQQTESSTWWLSIFQKQPRNLALPSLASLRLLTKLSVRNCNISEVCADIEALSCLERLDLSGNNFANLPGGLSQLSRLECLYLDGCKNLEGLPELPPSIWCLLAAGCTSLEEPPRLIYQQCGFSCDFKNCPKMFGNVASIDSQVCMSQTGAMDSSTTSHASTNQISLLVGYLGIQSKIREFFSGSNELVIILHGNRIPEWFTNKSKGGRSHYDVKVELPPNWCYSKFKGFGICVVFKPKEESYHRKLHLRVPGYSVNNFDGASIYSVPTYYLTTLQMHDTDDTMICLHFKTRDSGWKEAKNFVTFTFGDKNEYYEVKGCGVRLVCDEEEETVLSMIQHLPPQPQSEPTAGLGFYRSFFWSQDSDHFISFSW